MPAKTLKCCGCKQRFPAETMNKLPAGNFHSIDCAIQYSQAKQERARAKVKAKAIRLRKSEEKAARSKHRADLKRVNRSPRAEALKAAQLLARVSNADDDGYCTCVSCGALIFDDSFEHEAWNRSDQLH